MLVMCEETQDEGPQDVDQQDPPGELRGPARADGAVEDEAGGGAQPSGQGEQQDHRAPRAASATPATTASSPAEREAST